MLFPYPLQGLQSIPALAHAQVEQDSIGFLMLQRFNSLLAAYYVLDDKALPAEQGEISGKLGIIIDQQKTQPVTHVRSS
ncbi:MAG: hypothetical protein BWY77_01687 [bacterium ADurb.Bin431]|nr:MAG: hypothetical protein BWY77_01687 [bacterium ADurb.Bin431]